MNIGNGWNIPNCGFTRYEQEPIVIGAYEIEKGRVFYFEKGSFVDMEGTLLNYTMDIKEIVFNGERTYDRTIVDFKLYDATKRGDSYISNVYALDVSNSHYEGWANYDDGSYEGIDYRLKLDRYDGTTMYFKWNGDIVAKVDKFENVIKYEYMSRRVIRRITDTYGRIINFEYEGPYLLQSISVNDKTVITYQKEIQNGENDPNDVLKTDNIYLLKVKHGDDIVNNEVIYKSKLKQDMLKLYNQAPYNKRSIENYQTYCIEEVLYPTGGKAIYSYDKANVYNWRSGLTRDKRKIRERKEILTGSNDLCNHYVYTYNNPEEGKSKDNKTYGYTHTSTTIRQNDNFTIYDTYDREEYLIENKIKSENNVIKTIYEYEEFNEGNKKIVKETVQEYDSATPSQYIERITTKNYNDYQQPTLEKQGELEISYSYDTGGYSLMTVKAIKRNANNQTRTEYILSQDGKTVQIENIYDRIISNGQKTLKESRKYIYNTNGEITDIIQSPDGNTANNITITTEYNYLDIQDIQNNPDQNTLTITTTVNNIDNITDDDGNIINGANMSTTNTYDLFGNIVTSVDGKNNITQYQYDSLNRIKKQTNPDLTYKERFYNNSAQEIIAIDEK